MSRKFICSIKIILHCCICIMISSSAFSQEDTTTLIDKLSIFSTKGQHWCAEGIKLNDEPNFGGYERIDMVTYTSQGDSADDLRTTKYQVEGLIGLKILRAEVLVNIGFDGYGILLEYSWTNSHATPRNYYKTVEILRIKDDSVISLWKYNTEEDLDSRGNRVKAYIDFMRTSNNGNWDIIINRSVCKKRDLRSCKYTRGIYHYKDGQFQLVKTEKAAFYK